MARTRKRLNTGPADDPAIRGLADRVRLATERLAALRAERDGALRLAQAAQAEEAMTRSELSVALAEALRARAGAETAAAARLVQAWAASPRGRLRRHNRLSRLFDRLLSRLGAWGRRRIVERSGLADENATLFDAQTYLERYPDVAAAGVPPLIHYLLSGGREGRSPHPLFDPAWYAVQADQEIAAHGVTPLEHFVRRGAGQGLSPHPLFDVGGYLAKAEGLTPGANPLLHYLNQGARAGLSPHPLFDPDWYRDGGLHHYLAVGSRVGASPHPLFDPARYIADNPEVAADGREPLTHYVAEGGAAGRPAGPWFDSARHIAARGGAIPAGVNPLVDYLTGGAWALAEGQEGQAATAFIARRPDLARAGVTPLEHLARRARKP
jgi:hypothetical protein